MKNLLHTLNNVHNKYWFSQILRHLEQKDRRKGSEYTYVWLSGDGIGDISLEN